SLTAEESPRLRPYMELAAKLGSLVGQVEGTRIRSVSIEVEGAAAALNQKPITGAVLAGLMQVFSDTVKMGNAPFLARDRGLDVRGEAVSLVAVDGHIGADLVKSLETLPGVKGVKPLRF